MIQQRDIDSGDSGKICRPVVANRSQHCLDVVLRNQHLLHATPNSFDHPNCKSVDMKQRDYKQVAICTPLRVPVPPRISLHDVGKNIAMRKHRAFRNSGCSAGVLQHRHILIGVDFKLRQIGFSDTGKQICHSYCAFNDRRRRSCSRVLRE